MGLVTQDTKNLVAGVSQQPVELRHAEQLEEQLNGVSTETGGLQKRPPSTHIAVLKDIAEENLENVDTSKPLIHFIDRDTQEKYLVVFNDNIFSDVPKIAVFDTQGNKQEVIIEEDPDYIHPRPREYMRLITIADYTFIVNKEEYIKLSGKTTPDVWKTQGALVNIKQGQYGRTYRIVVNGDKQIASHSTPDGSDKAHTAQIATDYIVDKIAEQVTKSGYTVNKGPSWLYIEGLEGETWTEEVTLEPSTTYSQQMERFKSRLSDHSTAQVEMRKNPERLYVAEMSFLDFWVNKALGEELARCLNDRWTIYAESHPQGWGPKWVELVRNVTTEPVTNNRPSTLINSIQVYDGFNNQAAYGILRSVQNFTLLPASAPNGFICKISGKEGSTADDYYVKYDASEETWRECARPGIDSEIDPKTMPHVLVREADGTFVFRRGEWAERKIGDDDSNPVPSFVDNQITDIAFHRNRLVVSAGENICTTKSADFFDFWVGSAMSIQDTDPIDLPVSSESIQKIHYMVPYDEDLVLFTDDSQFILKSEGVLTPTTATLPPAVTRFGASKFCKPVPAGRNLYFVAERANFTTVREFYTAADNTESKDAQDITSHIPNYLPNTVYKALPSPVENFLLFLSEGDLSAMYVYKYLFVESVRQQAAWSKWDFQGTIYGAGYIDNYLYIVIRRNNTVCLERVSFAYNTTDYLEEPYRVLLDRKVTYKIPEGSYDAVSDETRISIHDILPGVSQLEYCLVTPDGLIVNSDENDEFELVGNYDNITVIVGAKYLFRAALSTILLKRSDQDGRPHALTEGRLQLKYVKVKYSSSGYFKVITTIFDKGEYVSEFTSRIMGTSFNRLDTLTFHSGEFKVGVSSLNTNCAIAIETKEPNPVAFTGISWTGDYNRRTTQY